jgi:hypothetical protein
MPGIGGNTPSPDAFGRKEPSEILPAFGEQRPAVEVSIYELRRIIAELAERIG